MRRALRFIAVACLAGSHIAAADSGVKSLLGVVPGDKSPIQVKSMGAPFDTYRMPTSDRYLESWTAIPPLSDTSSGIFYERSRRLV